jgi:hypothetical protein
VDSDLQAKSQDKQKQLFPKLRVIVYSMTSIRHKLESQFVTFADQFDVGGFKGNSFYTEQQLKVFRCRCKCTGLSAMSVNLRLREND